MPGAKIIKTDVPTEREREERGTKRTREHTLAFAPYSHHGRSHLIQPPLESLAATPHDNH